MKEKTLYSRFGFGFLMLILAGCAPADHGKVTGVVKINGESVEGVTVVFTPLEGGRSAFARTAADGTFEMNYTPGVQGAKLGTNKVSLSTFVEESDEEAGPAKDEGRPELFPPEYNEESTLRRDVERGSNEFEFDIQIQR